MGRDNLEVIELTHRHCRHARIELVNGNSPVGGALDLPMGLMEVRCEHASPHHVQGHQARELAIEFYEENCRGCPYRDGTGELPNLATVAAERAAEFQAGQAVLQDLAAEWQQRFEARRERRQRQLAGEGHVVRDLGAAIDRVDRPGPRVEATSPGEEQAARSILDTAREAPNLFRPVLVDSLLELAEDIADGTALEAIHALVLAGACPPRRALDVALHILAGERSVEAARLLALLEPELQSSDIPPLLDRLIDLTSGSDLGPLHEPVSTQGLIAASHIDLTVVIDGILEHLGGLDDRRREAGAVAAGVLLRADPTRVVALGPPLAASVQSRERGYAGYPHPNSAALGALADGWRGDPTFTRRVIEDAAALGSQEAKDELSRVTWVLLRHRQPSDATTAATSEAIDFLVRRASGDWGEEAADRAAELLLSLVKDIPDAVAPHTQALLGTVLSLCAPRAAEGPLELGAATLSALDVLEQGTLDIRRASRRRRLAGAIGGCAAVDPAGVLSAVYGLFLTTTGDDDHDRTVRTTMLDVLEKAVSPNTLRDVLPILYSALLDGDHFVRRAGIDLWAVCIGAADALPSEVTALAQPLLEDVDVHRRMLEKLPYLHLPAELAQTLVSIAARWVQVYGTVEPTRTDGLNSAIRALRSLAGQLENEPQATAWFGVALSFVERCTPYDRERLLTAFWPVELRNHPVWTTAALHTIASPEMVDYYNQRHEPLLEALLEHPELLVGIPLGEIEPLSRVHGPDHPWRALEPLELLQAAGRWDDAASIAREVEARQRPGKEGEPGRRLAGMLARSAEFGQLLSEGLPSPDGLTDSIARVGVSVADLEASASGQLVDGQLRFVVDTINASIGAARILLDPVASNPLELASGLDAAAQLLANVPVAHAAGAQRQLVATAWKIASTLLRYDAAVRTAESGSYGLAPISTPTGPSPCSHHRNRGSPRR